MNDGDFVSDFDSSVGSNFETSNFENCESLLPGDEAQ